MPATDEPGAEAPGAEAPGAEAPGAAARSPVPSSSAPSPPVEPRQRWRLTFARDPVPADQVGRIVLEAWQDALVESGLPVAGLETGGVGRARIAFAAPLPAAARGDAELADLWLLERRPLWALRDALADRLPAAHRWIDAEDVWLAAPALAGRVVAADWRVEVADPGVPEPGVRGDSGFGRDRLADAGRRLMAARTLPRTRVKGSNARQYDLRPLLAEVIVEGGTGQRAVSGPIVVRVRTRFHPELGTGRPEEVIAALGDAVGITIEIVAMSRERLLLADGLPAARRR